MSKHRLREEEWTGLSSSRLGASYLTSATSPDSVCCLAVGVTCASILNLLQYSVQHVTVGQGVVQFILYLRSFLVLSLLGKQIAEAVHVTPIPDVPERCGSNVRLVGQSSGKVFTCLLHVRGANRDLATGQRCRLRFLFAYVPQV